MNDDKPRFAEGGIVNSDHAPAVAIRIERIGQGADGICMYSVNGGPPEAILTAQQVKELAPLALKRLREAL